MGFVIYDYISEWGWGVGLGFAYVVLPFPESGCPMQHACIYFVPDMINICDNLSTFIHLHRMFPPTDIFFWTTDWKTQNGPPLYQIFILCVGYSAGGIQALQLVLLVVFGAVDEPLAFCMTVHFGYFFFKNNSWYVIFVLWRGFYILCICISWLKVFLSSSNFACYFSSLDIFILEYIFFMQGLY